jgi:hypothetical protein
LFWKKQFWKNADISETQKLFQTSKWSARNLNLLAVPQLDTQPAVDIVFGGFDPAEVDDLGGVRPKESCRAKSLLDGCERAKDEWGIATKRLLGVFVESATARPE